MKRLIAPEASMDWCNSILSPEQVERILTSSGIPLSERYPKRAYEMVLAQKTTQLCWSLFDKNPPPAILRNFSTQLEKLFVSVEGAAYPAPRAAYQTLQRWAAQELNRPRRTSHNRYHARAIPWLVAFFQVSFDQSKIVAGDQSLVTLFAKCYFDVLNQALKIVTLQDPQERGRTVQPFAPKDAGAIRKSISLRVEFVAQEEPVVHLDLAAATEIIGVKGN